MKQSEHNVWFLRFTALFSLMLLAHFIHCGLNHCCCLSLCVYKQRAANPSCSTFKSSPVHLKETQHFLYVVYDWDPQQSFYVVEQNNIPGILCAFQTCTNLSIPIVHTWQARSEVQNLVRLSSVPMASRSGSCTRASFRGSLMWLLTSGHILSTVWFC